MKILLSRPGRSLCVRCSRFVGIYKAGLLFVKLVVEDAILLIELSSDIAVLDVPCEVTLLFALSFQ